MKKLLLALLVVLTVSTQSDVIVTSIPLSSPLYGAFAFSDETCFVTGAGIWRTTNGGVNFHNVHNGGFTMDIIFVKNSNVAYALTGNPNGPAFQAPVYKTTNGGLNWFNCFAPQGNLFFTKLYTLNETEVYGISPGAVIGSQNRLYRSSNGGTNFTMICEVGGSLFSGMVANAPNEYYLASSSCLYSDDLIHWSVRAQPLNFVQAAPKYQANRLFFAGTLLDNNINYSTISYSESQGNTWIDYSFDDSDSCKALDFSSTGVGYSIGQLRNGSGYWLAQSTNNGTSWERLHTSSSMIMKNMSVAKNTVYIVGKHGTNAAVMIYRDELLGINSNQTIPKQFELKQNFPNPFNPSTTINYSVPEKSLVRITIFDISGKEVRTIVNAEHHSGNYSVRFDGSGLASGTYFYKIQAGSFIETKKMMLIK